MPGAHGPILRRKELEKSRSESPIFYRSESAHMDRLFIAGKSSDIPYYFYQSYCAVTIACYLLLWDYVTVGFFIGPKSAHTDRFLSQTDCLKERSDFLSDQKSAHTNRFSLRFSVYDKNRSDFFIVDKRSVRVRLFQFDKKNRSVCADS